MSFSLNRKKSDKVRQYYVHDYEINAENDIVPTPFHKGRKNIQGILHDFFKISFEVC